MENLARHISDLHVVDRQRSFLTDLRSTKNPKLLSFVPGYWYKFQKTENLRNRIIQFSI